MSEELLPDLFCRAVDLDADGRRHLLEQVRAEDPALAAALERLLAADRSEAASLDRVGWDGFRSALEAGMVEAPPERIGPYRVVRELGRGGMGRVFLAEEETADFRRLVALKIVEHPGPDAEAVRRFRDEVRILASLEHPGIARFFDGGRTADGVWFLALEYVEGEDLSSFVRARGLGVRARVELFLQVLDAVDFAHRRLVVHRDLKPSNVLIGADGRAKLLDFGISKIVEPDGAAEAITRPGLRALTPAYASPEQLRGERATIAADVYSLGVVLYELLAGRRPFAGREAGDSIRGQPTERDPRTALVRRAPSRGRARSNGGARRPLARAGGRSRLRGADGAARRARAPLPIRGGSGRGPAPLARRSSGRGAARRPPLPDRQVPAPAPRSGRRRGARRRRPRRESGRPRDPVPARDARSDGRLPTA